ncbi:ABC transporter substrate-binding protein [Thermomonospora umbrina]|uniref:Iron complex transport system substrate-binding protein n=1 Tax=Thermomonospora umbrina TaxID=111806 RepID=A0A3D9SQV5_9ACTN|nr:ABC transporter substrate-binding protein [Thermomonospora umbrina]REE96880.1 iron complex transport system substrate-binding protein [Thermomonospora umbrina]
MGMSRPLTGTLVALLLALTACGGDSGDPGEAAAGDRCVGDFDPAEDYFPVKQTVRHASNFTLRYAKNYQVITVKQPSPGVKPETYVLVRCGTPAPALTGPLAGAVTVETPVAKVFAGSTTHLPFLTELGALDRLKGVAAAGLITSPQVRALVKAGTVVEYGGVTGEEVDTEKVIGARPDVLMTDGRENRAYGPLRQAGVKILANAEWQEATPLGRAEWIKFVAALTGGEATATRVFDKVAADYGALVAKAAKASPVTVLPGQMFQGQWAVPNGGSFTSRLIKDAGGTHAWAATPGTGSATLDLEAVLAKARGAKIWLPQVNEWKTLADVTKADPRHAEFAAFTSGDVWSINKVLGPGGGNDFYERGVGRPDLILADLVAVLHPELSPGHTFTFYRRLTR